MKSSFKFLLVLVVSLLAVSPLMAQREKNNIFVFDCTGSMKTNQLWEPAKKALEETIKNQSAIPGTQFIVIPFGTEPDSPIVFNNYDQKQNKEILEILEKDIKGPMRMHTNISAALMAGFNNVNPNKDNNIFLLTDGEPDGEDTSEKVAETINKWCGNHKNSKLYYVTLNHRVNEIIKRAVEACQDAYVVEIINKTIPSFVDIEPGLIYTNLEELSVNPVIDFNMPGTHNVRVISSDPLFNVKAKDGVAKDGKIRLVISPKNGQDTGRLHQEIHGKDYSFPVILECVDQTFRIVNPTVMINVSDERPIKLTLGNGEEELSAEGVKWHDSFLWSGAKASKSVEWDLAPLFENETPDSSLKLKFQLPEGEKEDFQAMFNGKKIKSGDVLNIVSGQPAILKVQFDEKAKTGKRYFSLVPIGQTSLDMVNGVPTDNYTGTSLRTEYKVGWNPLKTFFFWLGIVLLALLVVWFLLMKPFIFPTIKVGKVDITGPGSYFKTKKLKGARKVVFSSKTRSQNIFSRIFTGEVRYVKADHFTPELVIIPASGNRKVKVKSEGSPGGWDVYPSAIFTRYEKGTITNKKTNEKSQIEFS